MIIESKPTTLTLVPSAIATPPTSSFPRGRHQSLLFRIRLEWTLLLARHL